MAPLKVYYLDDEIDLLEMFRELFSSPEIEIRTFADPTLAIAEVWRAPPDLLILDYRLPNTTGDKIAQLLDPALPKIMITGDLAVKTTSSFVRIFHKPYDFAEMADFLEAAQARRRAG